MTAGRGTVPMFATVPIIDLQEYVHKLKDPFDVTLSDSIEKEHLEVEPLRILLLGTADTGYILKTLANASNHPKRPLHFYVVEPQIPLLARHLLFLNLWFSPLFEGWSIPDKEALYFELYGNLTLKEKTHTWLQAQIPHLIQLITKDENFSTLPWLHLNHLKYKERDDLESVFKFWKSSKPFPIQHFWEHRLRHYYQTRYDSRENLMDWDYHMKLSPKLPQLCKTSFLRWRLTGIAFETNETSGQYPNRTLASVSLTNSSSSNPCWGYWSDILHSPLLAFHALTSSFSKNTKSNAATNAPSSLGSSLFLNMLSSNSTTTSSSSLTFSSVPFDIFFLSSDVQKLSLIQLNQEWDVGMVGVSMSHHANQLKATRILVESVQFNVELNASTIQRYISLVETNMKEEGYVLTSKWNTPLSNEANEKDNNNKETKQTCIETDVAPLVFNKASISKVP